MKIRILAVGICAVLIVGLGIWAAVGSGTEHEIGCYVTGLRGRTPSQIHNVALASRRINNTVLLPGQTFSFVKTVGPWTADMGYEKAPVSYDGELVRSWGGGVCQASTTLYNAALLSGLKVTERYRHHWPARYAPLGRDAAVAYAGIDLKFRNNLPAPVRIVCRMKGDSLIYKILSTYKPDYNIRIESEMKSVELSNEVIQDNTDSGSGRWKLINRGHPGFRLVTYRRFIYSQNTRREFLSEDHYPSMSKIVRVCDR